MGDGINQGDVESCKRFLLGLKHDLGSWASCDDRHAGNPHLAQFFDYWDQIKLPSNLSYHRIVQRKDCWYSEIKRIKKLIQLHWTEKTHRLSLRLEVRPVYMWMQWSDIEGYMQGTKPTGYSDDSVIFLHIRNIWKLKKNITTPRPAPQHQYFLIFPKLTPMCSHVWGPRCCSIS